MRIKFLLFVASQTVSAVLLSDQGTSVRNLTGSLLELGNLTILIYSQPTTGDVIFNSTTQDSIINGSWNLMINPSLEYGLSYWKDYEINGEDLDFDGNERLEFQSGLGLINNVSFINFSMINSCPIGSSIRLIYSNGSVECQSFSNSSSGTDLTNYALKNQSEIFSGNITTSHTGFFGFLGNLANRITKLFVMEIDASGNINSTGNVTASYFKGDGSLLTNLATWTETDPIFVSENSTLWVEINSKLAQTDQRYNETTLILSVNRTTNIMSLGFYNETEVDNLISASGNLSFNQSLTDTLYYSVSNPSGFINNTSLSAYNDTSLILTTNSSLWSYISVNGQNWISTFNSTYNSLLGSQCANGYFVNGTLANGTFICASSTISESDPLWTANSTLVLYSNSLPLANKTIVHCSNITGASSNLCTVSNSAGNIFDQALNTTSNVIFASVNATGEIYVANVAVKQWLYNQTVVANSYTDSIVLANNASWTSTYNSTYAANQANNSWNETRANNLYAGIQWGYNQTTISNNYVNSVNSSITLWVENIFAKITNVFNRTEILNQYYNRSDITSLGYVNSSGLSIYNDTATINSLNQSISLSKLEITDQRYNETNLINLINQTLTSSKLDFSEQRYNDTALILSVNSTSNIMSLSFYNKSEISNLLSNVGNSSFNQSLTDSLYYSINNLLNFINHTQANIYNDTAITLVVNSSLWSYINLNQAGWISTYNITYAGLINNASYLSTYNITYDTILNQHCQGGQFVNGTFQNGTLRCSSITAGQSSNLFNQWLNTSSNVTFANLTVSSNSAFANNLSASSGFFGFLGSALTRITKLFVVDLDVSNNITVSGNISAQFYFGSLNRSTFPTSTCSGTDKVVSILTNGTVNCDTDETSGGSSGTSFNNFNLTLLDISTTDNGAYTEVLTLPLSNGANILIECVLLQDAAVTGTGVRYESTLTGTSSARQVMEYYSSATAQAICSGASSTLTCSPSSSSGTTVTPNRLYVYAVTSSTGIFTLNVKSETSNAVTVRAGSWCRSIET